MKQQDMALVFIFGIVAAVLAFIVSNKIFKVSSESSKVPQVVVIDPSIPDIRNDSNYSVIFNSNALDPTQPVKIGDTNNNVPFR